MRPRLQQRHVPRRLEVHTLWTSSTIKSWRPSCSKRISSDKHEDIASCDQAALTHITSAPHDNGPSDEDVIVANRDDTTLSRGYNHSLSTATCINLTSARIHCSLQAAIYICTAHMHWLRRAASNINTRRILLHFNIAQESTTSHAHLPTLRRAA